MSVALGLSFGEIVAGAKVLKTVIVKIKALLKDGFQFTDVADLVAELGSDEEFAKELAKLFQMLK
jgi:hypothetical protein